MLSEGIFLENMERRVHGGLNVWRKKESWLRKSLVVTSATRESPKSTLKAESHGGEASGS
jgi:hypothetical protein